ncbi:3'-5' exonuclease [Halomicroarcula sp. GCM10025324]|uniref:3'-5' exonuclease n=1 Tax=Haloarcula TaxID=2237 RepID=UPI0023E7C327|nr:3'-5' exonuclease [Halomicroarcula sp. ZS-22-S1]
MSQPRSHTTQQIRGRDDLTGTIAIDIETINLVPEPDIDFADPTHWTLFCIPLGYRSPEGDVETDVLFRRGPSLCDERELLDRFIEWIRERRPARLITYNGEFYDIPVIRHRAERTTEECRGHHTTHDDLQLILDVVNHHDLFTEVKRQAGFNVKLESALQYHDIETVETRLDGNVIDGSDMPNLGLRILDGEATLEEIEAVREYAESDVQPLFQLETAVQEHE